MKLKSVFIILLFCCTSISFAQNASPELKGKINDIYNHLEKYKKTTPLWKQRYDAAMSAGNYFYGIKEYQKAANAYGQALKYAPGDQTAMQSRDYCRQTGQRKFQEKCTKENN